MIRLVVANVADNAKAVDQVAVHAEYAILNEVRGHAVDELVHLRANGWRVWFPAGGARQNSHLWDPDHVGTVTHGTRLILAGGHRGSGRSRRDKRRRGPSRYGTWQLVYDLDTRGLVLLYGLHNAAKGTTTARWRLPLVMAAFHLARVQANVLRRRYPGVPQVMGGDGNVPRLGQWRMGKSWHLVRTPADFGHRHYTQVYYRGPVEVRNVHHFDTASDHHALVMDLEPAPAAPRFGGHL